MSARLELVDMTAGYAGVPAVRSLSLHVDAGQVVALLGANGAGKTTTLSVIAGTVPLLSGSVRFDGAELGGSLHRRARRGIAVITEDRSLLPHLSVRDNLRLAGPVERHCLALFPELEPHLGQAAGQLSGGEQQLLAVGRAIAARPRLLVVDELSLGLAPLVVRRLLAALADAARDGTAVLLVEQHARAALELADHAYVLCRGALTMHGPAPALLADFDAIERSYLHGQPAAGVS